MVKKKLLITGISGLLGSNLAYCLRNQYEILGIYNSYKIAIDGVKVRQCDLCQKVDVKYIVEDFSPEIIVHAAAQANVEICEEDSNFTDKINVMATKNIVEILHGTDVKLIYISSDLVYDGVKGDFSEEDLIGPLNKYAESKVAAEREVLKNSNAIVFRTNFFGWNIQKRESLGEWVINALRSNRKIKGFIDAKFSSIYTFDLAQILDRTILKNLSGVYNLGSRTSVSKYDFAVLIATNLSFDSNLIEAVSIDEFDFKAKRSKNLSLNVGKIEKDIERQCPSLEDSVKHFIKDFQLKIYEQFKSFGVLNNNIYPKLSCIPYGRQSIDDDDIAAVVEVLKSSNLTQGPKIEEFESRLCEITGSQFAVAVNSGTSALHIACMAAGMTEGWEGITSPNTFVASANCIAYCGGNPVFGDIDSKTYNISPFEIQRKISEKTKVVIPVHFAGQSCDMKTIEEIVRRKEKKYGHKIFIIEDASHALGSQYANGKVGSCEYSDMTVFSFHPVKHITTGEGGALLTNDKELHRKFCYLRSNGVSNYVEELEYKEQVFELWNNKEIKKPWYYEQHWLGYNYRVTDMQCALGLSQLNKLSLFIKRRREIVDYYNKEFSSLPNVQIPFESDCCLTNFHLYVLRIDFKAIEFTRTQIMMDLKDRGILTQVHYIPVHTQPYYQKNYGMKWGDFPNAEEYYQQCLSLPLYSGMTDDDVKKVVSAINESLR